MIENLFDDSGRQVDKHVIKKLAIGLVGAASSYIVGSAVLSCILRFTGVGLPAALGINAGLNFLYTVRIGNIVSSLLDRDQFDLRDMEALLNFIAPAAFNLTGTTALGGVE